MANTTKNIYGPNAPYGGRWELNPDPKNINVQPQGRVMTNRKPPAPAPAAPIFEMATQEIDQIVIGVSDPEETDPLDVDVAKLSIEEKYNVLVEAANELVVGDITLEDFDGVLKSI